MAGDGAATHGFAFEPVLKPEAADRLNHMGIVKNIEFSFFVPGVLSQDISARQSLSSILDNPLVGTADRVRIQLSASRSRVGSLAVNHARAIVSELIGIRDDVLELNVLAKETEDAPSETVDFINARLEADIPVHRIGRRYGQEQRWAALKQTFDTWRDNGYFS